jgi:hypothetical protein
MRIHACVYIYFATIVPFKNNVIFIVLDSNLKMKKSNFLHTYKNSQFISRLNTLIDKNFKSH